MSTSPVANIELRLQPALRRVEVINKLESLLKDAKEGKIATITGVVEYAGGEFQNFATASESRLKTAGALLDAAIAKLGYAVTDEVCADDD